MSNSQWHNDQAIGEKAMRETEHDGTHCVHWWDCAGPCCRCGYNGRRETPCNPCKTKRGKGKL